MTKCCSHSWHPLFPNQCLPEWFTEFILGRYGKKSIPIFSASTRSPQHRKACILYRVSPLNQSPCWFNNLNQWSGDTPWSHWYILEVLPEDMKLLSPQSSIWNLTMFMTWNICFLTMKQNFKSTGKIHYQCPLPLNLDQGNPKESVSNQHNQHSVHRTKY